MTASRERNGILAKVASIVAGGVLLTAIIGGLTLWVDARVQAATIERHDRRLRLIETTLDKLAADQAAIALDVREARAILERLEKEQSK
jgi:hypothetical protein